MLDLPAVARAAAGARAGVAEVEAADLCTSCNPDLFYSHRRDGERTGRQAGLAWLEGASGPDGRAQFTGLDPDTVRANLERVREKARARASRSSPRPSTSRSRRWGRSPRRGSTLVGENRLQDLEAKRERWGDAFDWDFIGNLQSRKVKGIVPLVRLIHSLATRFGPRASSPSTRARETAVLVEVNLGGRGEQGRRGRRRSSARSSSAARLSVEGLMTMPPFTEDPEASRPYFARLAELAAEHGLERLSMGTSQDWRGGGGGGRDDHQPGLGPVP